jgi:hypothetical protein
MALVGNWIPSGNDQARLQALFRNLVQSVTNSQSYAAAVNGILTQMAPSTTYTDIETFFGVPTGSGQSLHDIVGTVNTNLQAAAILQLTQRFG